MVLPYTDLHQCHETDGRSFKYMACMTFVLAAVKLKV